MEQMLEAYAAVVRAKDVDAFLNLYANDARGRRREGAR
jgi:ketosteroid isomerase-like protein